MTRSRLGRALLFGLALGASAVLVAAGWVSAQLAPAADEGEAVLFEVRPGEPLAAVARNLEAAGLVRNARVTAWRARLAGQAKALKAGEYRLSPALSPAEILERIAEGRVATWEVVIPEGLTAREVGARLAGRGLVEEPAFEAAVHDPALAEELGIPAATLEGYLYPETYRLPRGLAARDAVRVLVSHFHEAWSELEPLARERGLSMHEAVILASIVEKETGAAHERPLIASVFANRLARGMRLESDPTVIYGIVEFDGNLRRRDLEDAENPYNTYRHAGLPPSPIANPGFDSLRAVVAPADTDFLFFVSRGDGTHHFSTTYREHVGAVDRYQRGGRTK